MIFRVIFDQKVGFFRDLEKESFFFGPKIRARSIFGWGYLEAQMEQNKKLGIQTCLRDAYVNVNTFLSRSEKPFCASNQRVDFFPNVPYVVTEFLEALFRIPFITVITLQIVFAMLQRESYYRKVLATRTYFGTRLRFLL